MERAELQQHARRLRWRLRGAWQWPAFVVLTGLDAVVLTLLPCYEPGPGGLFPALLLAGFGNLFCVAILAPFAGRAVRARRPDLPRVVARDYAGTMLLALAALAAIVAGAAHRPAAEAAARERGEVFAAVHAYVSSQAPRLQRELGRMDVVEIENDRYRACVPRETPQRWLCLFVNTDQHPPGLKLDPSQVSNEEMHAGPR
jgi:hypothetical protein